jgi:hypothetical protein
MMQSFVMVCAAGKMHDAGVVGDEPAVSIEFASAATFAKR